MQYWRSSLTMRLATPSPRFRWCPNPCLTFAGVRLRTSPRLCNGRTDGLQTVGTRPCCSTISPTDPRSSFFRLIPKPASEGQGGKSFKSTRPTTLTSIPTTNLPSGRAKRYSSTSTQRMSFGRTPRSYPKPMQSSSSSPTKTTRLCLIRFGTISN